jgi:peptide/nickel transport system substrate-binding protein
MKGSISFGSRAVFLSILCAIVLGASALVLPAANVQAEEDTGTLNIAVQQDLPDLNIFNPDTNSVWKTKVLSWAFEGLMGLDEDGLPYPLLAESVTFDEESLTAAITLRQGIMFNDGHELTAHDVVFTYSAVRTGTVYSAQLIAAFDADQDGVLAPEEFEYAINQTGEYDLLMSMSVPYAHFFSSTLTVPIIPQHIWEAHLTADDIVDVYWSSPEAVIGTGPFTYAGGALNEYREMTKNDLYWGKEFVTPNGYRTFPPNIDLMHFVVIYDIDAAIAALQSGAVDYIAWAVTPDRVPALETDPAVGIEYMADNGYFYLGFNEKLDPFGSLSFRQAVAQLVDKETIVDEFMGGIGVVGTTCLSPYWGEWHNEAVAGYEYDDPTDDSSTVPETLLDSAGFVDVDGDGWRDLPDGTPTGTLTILTPPETYDPIRYDTGQMIAASMRAAGLNAESIGLDLGTLADRIYSMDYQMTVMGWRGSSDPASSVFDTLGPLATTNIFGFWSLENPNPYYEDLLGVSTLADVETQAMADLVLELGNLAESTVSVQEQQDLTREAQAVIHDAVPVEVLYYRVSAEAHGAAWTGWVPYLGTLLNTFTLSQLEEIPTSGSVTVVKYPGQPSLSVVEFGLGPRTDCVWTGTVETHGLKGLEIEVYDMTSGEAVLMAKTTLQLAKYPEGAVVDLGQVSMSGGSEYLFVLTPLGPDGGYATLDWYLG